MPAMRVIVGTSPEQVRALALQYHYQLVSDIMLFNELASLAGEGIVVRHGPLEIDAQGYVALASNP